ncbi:MAG: ferrous iron transport protein A [Alphaproteobacteria bacterium]|nr:ferrous iron transport protein A [Alphaproteobacteria bacterium]
MRLDRLEKGRPARVRRLNGADPLMEAKLREVGFAEDDEVEIVHFGPLAARPICVRLNQTLIALRAEEAAAIEVKDSL